MLDLFGVKFEVACLVAAWANDFADFQAPVGLYDNLEVDLVDGGLIVLEPADIFHSAVADQHRQLIKLAERIDAELAAEFIEKAYKTMRWIDSSVNEKLIFEELLLNLVKYDNIRV